MITESGSFPNSTSKCGSGVPTTELALATRAFFQLRAYPEKLMEKVESIVHRQKWHFYMPALQPIGLLWQHGKHYMLASDAIRSAT